MDGIEFAGSHLQQPGSDLGVRHLPRVRPGFSYGPPECLSFCGRLVINIRLGVRLAHS